MIFDLMAVSIFEHNFNITNNFAYNIFLDYFFKIEK